MAVTFLNGIETIKFGPAGVNGAMGANLTRITPITDGSVSMTIPEKASVDITAEDVEGVVASLAGVSEAITFVFSSLDVSGENTVVFLGGSYNSTTKIYTAPITPVTVEGSLEFTSRALKGFKIVFKFPLVSIIGSQEGGFTRGEISSLTATAKVLTPLDGTGVALPPYTKEYVAVA